MIRLKSTTNAQLETFHLIILLRILTVSMDIRLPLRYVERVPAYNKSRECLFDSEIKKFNSTWTLNLNHHNDNKSCFKCECVLKSVPPMSEGKFVGVVRCQKHEPVCPKLNCMRAVYIRNDCCGHCLNDIDAVNRKRHEILEKFGDSYCTHDGHEYAEKSSWQSRSDSCLTHSCQDGVVRTERVQCPKLSCRPNEIPNRDYRLRPNQCCPICKSIRRNSIKSTMPTTKNNYKDRDSGVAGRNLSRGYDKVTVDNDQISSRDDGCYLGEQFYAVHSEIQPIGSDPCTICYCEINAKIRCKRHQCDMLKNDYTARYVLLSRFEKQCFLHCFNKTKHTSRDFIPIRLKFNERKVLSVRPLATRHRTTIPPPTSSPTFTVPFRFGKYRNRHINNRIHDRVAAHVQNTNVRRNWKRFSHDGRTLQQVPTPVLAHCRLPNGSTIGHGSRFNPIVSSFVEKNIVCKCRKSILRCRFRDKKSQKPTRIAATSIMTRIATITNNRSARERQKTLDRNLKKLRTKKSQLMLLQRRRQQNPF